MSLALFLAIAAARVERPAVLSADALVSLDIDVNIGLLGFNADGAWQLELDAGELHGLLGRLLPERRPSCGPEGEPLDAVYRMRYNVVVMQTGIPRLQQRLARAMRRTAGSSKEFEVEVADVEDLFDDLYTSYFAHGEAEPHPTDQIHRPSAYTILILNPNRADMAALHGGGAPADLSYRYRYRGGSATQMWLAGSRYMVVDLSAGPVTLGRGQASEGTVSAASLPMLRPQLHGGAEGRKRREASPSVAAAYDLHHTHFIAQLATLLLSAVRSLIAPDVATCELDDFETLIVPIIVLADHDRFDPLQPGHAHSLDLQRLQHQLTQLLLPKQQLVLLPSSHQLHAHPQISIAVSQPESYRSPWGLRHACGRACGCACGCACRHACGQAYGRACGHACACGCGRACA